MTEDFVRAKLAKGPRQLLYEVTSQSETFGAPGARPRQR